MAPLFKGGRERSVILKALARAPGEVLKARCFSSIDRSRSIYRQHAMHGRDTQDEENKSNCNIDYLPLNYNNLGSFLLENDAAGAPANATLYITVL